jgi:inner membrane protein
MDNLTHTLIGLSLSRAGLNRYYARATSLLLVAANAPDFDVVTAVRGGFFYFTCHRGYTHSLAGAPVLALAVALVFCALDRSLRKLPAAFALALAGVGSHLLLDWTNAYGVRFLLPFSAQWFSLDLVTLIDVWIWTALILATVAPLVGRLVSSELGARSGTGRGWAVFALLFVPLFDAGRAVLHQRAVTTLESRDYDGTAPLKAGAFPTPANPFEWIGVVETGQAVHRYRFNLLGAFDPDAGAIFQKPEASPALDAAARTAQFRAFLGFSKYPLWSAIPLTVPESATKVTVRDMRFGFSIETVVDAANRPGEVKFSFSRGN